MAFWKISPGENAEHWDECLTGADFNPNNEKPQPYICTGWDDVGDVRSYADHQALTQAFKNAGYNDAIQSLWYFGREIKPGDCILANKGRSVAVGIGVVIGSYVPPMAHGNHRKYRQHLLPVDWIWKGAHQLSAQLAINAVYRLPEHQIRSLPAGA